MSSGKFGAEAFSPGDVMRELRLLRREVAQLRTARPLESAAVGSGGLRLHSGGSLVVDDGGDIRIAGGQLEAVDSDGNDVFVVTTNPASIFMQQDLITQLAIRIFAERITSQSDDDPVSTSSIAFTDLGGPTVSGVEISETGRAIVIVTAAVTAGTFGGGDVAQNGEVAYQVSGATSRIPVVWRALRNGLSVDTLGTEERNHLRASALALEVDLNPGTHSFSLRYRKSNAAAEDASFIYRNITVIAF